MNRLYTFLTVCILIAGSALVLRAYDGAGWDTGSGGAGFAGSYTGDSTFTGNMHITGSTDIDTLPFYLADKFTVDASGDLEAAGWGHFSGSLNVGGIAHIDGSVDIRSGTNAITSVYIGRFSGDAPDQTGASRNVCVGDSCLSALTSADDTTALGASAGDKVTSNSYNTLIGASSFSLGSGGGVGNTAVGASSMLTGTAGDYNIGMGVSSLYGISGDYNIGIGYTVARYHTDGTTTLTTPNKSIYIGRQILGDNADSETIVIGDAAVSKGANTTVLGNTNTTHSYNYGLPVEEVTAGITADAGSAQGGSPLVSAYNEIATCGTSGDSVTLPTAVAGLRVTITNHGANSADVFPATDDAINEGAADAAKALAADATMICFAYDAVNWECLTLAR